MSEDNLIQIQKIDSNEITTKLDKIFNTVKLLDEKIDLIQKKREVNKVFKKMNL